MVADNLFCVLLLLHQLVFIIIIVIIIIKDHETHMLILKYAIEYRHIYLTVVNVFVIIVDQVTRRACNRRGSYCSTYKSK